MTFHRTASSWTVPHDRFHGALVLAFQASQDSADREINCYVAAVNPAYEGLFVGGPIALGALLRDCLPSLWRAIAPLIYEWLQQEHPRVCQLSLELDSQALTLLTTLIPVAAPDGSLHLLGICQDATHKDESEWLQSATQALPESQFDTSLDVGLQQTGLEKGWLAEVWVPNAARTHLECSPIWYSHHPLQSFRAVSMMTVPRGESLPDRVWQSKQAEWILDGSLSIDECLRVELTQAVELKAVLAVPIVANQAVVAVVVIFLAEPRLEGQPLIRTVSKVLTQLGGTIQQRQTEAALGESQRKLTGLINALPGIAFEAANDAEWSMTYLSNGCAGLTGYRSEELIHNSSISFNDLTHPEDLSRVLATIRQAIATRSPYVVEYRLRTKSGQEKWVWEKGHGVYDREGQLVSLEGFISDITELKQADKALRQQEAFLRLLLDNLPLSIFWKNTQSVYLGCNKTFAALRGLDSIEDVIGKTDYELYGDLDMANRYRSEDRSVIESGLPMLNVIEHEHQSDGSSVWTRVSKLPIRDSEQQIVGVLVTLEDITDRQQAQAALQAAERKYRSIFENAVEGIFQTTPDGRYLVANPMLAKIYGYVSPEDLIACVTNIERQLYVDHERRQEFVRLVQETNAVWGFESQVYRKDGTIIWISESARTIRNEVGQLLGYEGTVKDITQRKQAEADLLQRDRLLQGVAAAMNHLLTNNDYDAAIHNALATLGQAVGVDRVYIYQTHPHPDTGQPAMSMRHEWTHESVEPSIQQAHWQNQPYSTFGMTRWYEALSSGTAVSGVVRELPLAEQTLLDRDGIRSILMVPILIDEQFWGHIGFDDCHTDRRWTSNEESILVAMAAGIGGTLKRQQAEATIRYQACHDLLTNLPNRMLFNDRLPLALANAHRAGTMLAVLFLDLDRFKTINDTLGHVIGDQLLQAVAQRLSDCLREGDTISRWGGDEFTLLLPQISHAEDAARVAQRMIEALKPAFLLEGHELYISCSIGIALYPRDGDDAQTLLKNADAALYRVKEHGRNSFQLYAPAINSTASERLALESSLHGAVERNEFVLHYQPQVDIYTWKVTRMEALLRWQHPEFGLIAPRVFIPLAEENGLIMTIGEWVLRTACAQNKAWQDAGLPALRIAVNLSARQFQQPQLVQMIAAILAETQLDSSYLELEITETTAMQNVVLTASVLQELHNMGIHVSIDDFGTGYSALSYLKKFSLHTIKIDQSFVQELPTDVNDSAIVQAMVTLGLGLNLNVVAEGVETREQLEYLRSLNCREVQGYLFSRPLSTDAATTFLREQMIGDS